MCGGCYVVYVGSEGPRTARIAIVGEKPGRVEVALKQPFAGPSGQQLNDLLSKIGLSRTQVYITNTCKNVANFETPTDRDWETT